ncbi:aminoglycoside phosphotransferase family protein [Microbacterium sp. MM2322]|uniref:phosphotransferase family protein n=1 Tax=Microbacterium sp. MM2322 TaxID=3157631 RepID=UPI0032D5ACDC
MGSAVDQDVAPPDVRVVAARFWPEWDWSAARATNGAFHQVAVLPDGPVARVTIGRDGSRRAAREHRILRILSTSDFPLRIPEPLATSEEATAAGAVLMSQVPGRPSLDVADRSQFRMKVYAETLTLFRQIPVSCLTDLPPPRSWCGGMLWTEIVAEELVPRLSADAGAAASAAIEDVLSSETEEVTFCHGDFGPHNMLWAGDDLSGLIDLDHACLGDPATDIAPLIGFHGARAASQLCSSAVLQRAMLLRATLPLQVAASAVLAGLDGLRDHALHNFRRRVAHGTLFDPEGMTPE